MSVSIETAWSALVFTIDLCEQVINAPSVVADVKKSTKRVKTIVGEIRKRMANPKSSFYSAKANIKEMIEADLEDILKGTALVKQILEERNQIPPWEMISLLFWITKRLPKLQDVTAKFDHSCQNITNVVSMFIHTDKLDAQEKKAERKVQAQLDEIQKMVQRMKKDTDKKAAQEALKKEEEAKKIQAKMAEEAARIVKEKNDSIKKLRDELKAAKEAHRKIQLETSKIPEWAEANQEALVEAALHPDAEARNVFINQLVSLGVQQKDAAAKVDTLLKTIRRERGRTMSWAHQHGKKTEENSKQNPQIKKPETRRKSPPNDGGKREEKGGSNPVVTNSASQNDDKKDKKASPPKTPENKPAKEVPQKQDTSPRPPQKKINTETKWILFVDSSNGDRSIMAQTYLEFVRNWTINTQKRWLFGRVDSAGLSIPTRFNKIADGQLKHEAGRFPNADPLSKIAGDKDYFRTQDPDEKQIILDRIRKHESRGLHSSDFVLYDHIICFTKGHQRALELLKAAATASEKGQVKSQVHYLASCDWYKSGLSPEKADEQLLKIRGKLKVVLKQFLTEVFGWERPTAGIALGKWRTLQFALPGVEPRKLREDKQVAAEMEKLGCTVYTTWDAAETLVSISGPKKNLQSSAQIIKGKY